MWRRTGNGRRWTLLLCLAVGLVVNGSPAVGHAHAATQEVGAVVALGDSFVSGEAGRWFGNARGGGASAHGTDRLCVLRWWGCELRAGGVYRDGPTANCHRSDTAPVEILSRSFSRGVNLACSGAIARDIYLPSESGPASGLAPQADRLRAVAVHQRVSLVILAVGANDVGFSDLVADCAEAWFTSRRGGCRRLGAIALARRLPTFKERVEMAIASVISAMKDAGYRRSGWEFIVHGYGSPVPPGRNYRYTESSVRRLMPGGCPFTDADSDWANGDLISTLNLNLRRLALAHGARFLDLTSAFDGHRVCETGSDLVSGSGPSGERAEWFRFLVPCCGGEKRESLHPNAYGQRAIAHCLSIFLSDLHDTGVCSGRPGFGPSAVRVTTRSAP